MSYRLLFSPFFSFPPTFFMLTSYSKFPALVPSSVISPLDSYINPSRFDLWTRDFPPPLSSVIAFSFYLTCAARTATPLPPPQIFPPFRPIVPAGPPDYVLLSPPPASAVFRPPLRPSSCDFRHRNKASSPNFPPLILHWTSAFS